MSTHAPGKKTAILDRFCGSASLEALTYERDVQPQGIQQGPEGDGHAVATGPLVEPVQPCNQVVRGAPPKTGGLIFDRFQLAIQPEYPASHGPAICCGDELQHRVE